MRVLVVEDSVKMAAVLKRGLEEEGYAVNVAQAHGGRASAENPPGGGALVTVCVPADR